MLVDVNECKLHDALGSQAEGGESRATQSVRVPVKNLRSVDPNVSVEGLQEKVTLELHFEAFPLTVVFQVGYEFLRRGLDGADGGWEAINRQRGFQMVRPDNDWFPGLDKLREELVSNLWVFGKTPKFTVRAIKLSLVSKMLTASFQVKRSFPLPPSLETSISSAHPPELGIELDVLHGVVRDVRVLQPLGLLDPAFDVAGALHGLTFGPDLPNAVADKLRSNDVDAAKTEFLIECVVEMVKKWV